MTETCITADEWRFVLARCYPDASPDEILVRADGAMFYGLRPDLSGHIYRAGFFPAYSYGYVEVPR